MTEEKTAWTDGKFVYAITLDDQWLTQREVLHMMEEMKAEDPGKGIAWQTLRIDWNEETEHYEMSAELYWRT